MSVIGGQNPIVQDGLVYILDFGNERSYVSGSNSAESLIYNPVIAVVTGSAQYQTPDLINGLLQFEGDANLTGSWIAIPQTESKINWYSGDFTIQFVSKALGSGIFLTQGSVSSSRLVSTNTPTEIEFGFYKEDTNNYLSRKYNNPSASLVSHYTIQYTSGSYDLFINGIPVSASGLNTINVPTTTANGIFISGRHPAKSTLWSGSLGNVLIYNRALNSDEIYSNYLQQARRYGLPETPKPYSIDENAYLYLQTAGITGSTEQTAVNNFVVGLKSSSLWDKMIAIYPFLGADTTKTRYNLKEPTLAFYDIEYTGNWSASLSGSYNNNTASYGILDEVRPNLYHPLISSQSIHLSYLSYDTPASGGYLMGVEQIPGLPGDIAAPAAAYSVRKVRTAYTGSAMEVRRDFDDLTFDVGFDGNGNLDTGSLLTNMTASGLTTTLPGDYSGLAAAYSLRKVSSSYSGYAVEVRRSSDNVSQSIGFDSFGNFDTASLDRFIATGSGVLAGSYSGLAAAYSLRKVVPGYSGFAIQIESASVTQDIGFDSFDNLDTASIASFAGSGDAFVKIWYDQSGNGYHVSQSNTLYQPKIYSGSQGAVIVSDNRPALQFSTDNTNKYINLENSSISSTQPFTVFASANRYTLDNRQIMMGSTPGTTWALGTHVTDNTIQWMQAGSTLDYGNVFTGSQLHYGLYNGASSEGAINGATSTTGNPGSNSLAGLMIGQNAGNVEYNWIGTINEVLIYTSSQASNRTYIENNINSYYGIYTPDSVSTEDAYVKTWYDQSGNGNHATQAVTSSQPQIVSSGVIVTENGKPALSFDGTNDQYNIPIIPFNINNISVIVLSKSNNTTSNGMVFSSPPDPRFYSGFINSSVEYFGYDTSPTTFNLGQANTTQSLKELYAGTLTANAYRNGIPSSAVPTTSTLAAGNNLSIGSLNNPTPNFFYNGNIQEIIFYTSDQSTNRGLIEDNINGYYNIFTHTLESGSGYVSKWYDQSGNNNHATQSVAANQPLILSSGSITTSGGIPSPLWPSYNQFLSLPRLTTVQSVFHVSQLTDSTGPNTFILGDISTFNYHGGNSIWLDNNAASYVRSGANYINGVAENFLTKVRDTNRNILTLIHTSPSGIVSQITRDRSISGRGWLGYIQELTLYTSDQTNNRQPIEQNINSYFNIYTPAAYNLNTNSLSLFSSPTTVAGAANAVASGITTGGPLGLITVSRTGSSDYTLWKNRVPNKVTIGASTPQSNELYLNAANVSNTLFSGSQNNISFASVGAGLTNDELYTYYELVDDLQTSLNRGVQDPNAFISVWDTTKTGTGTISGTSTIVLPFAGTPLVTASWGDGTESYISSSTQTDITHSYTEPGIYTVTVTGNHGGFRFGNGGDRAKIIDITQWGGNAINSGLSAYQGCFNLVGTAADAPAAPTALQWAFQNASRFKGYINNWNTSNLSGNSGLNQAFRGASSFNSPLDRWDVSKVTSFALAFNGTAFNQPIGNWRFSTSSTITFEEMFPGSPFNQNIGAWNVEKVTSMKTMLGYTPFNNGGSPDINNWRPISCSNFSNMFYYSTAFNQPIGNWPLSASSINMGSMFDRASTFNQDIGNWDVSKVTNMANMFNLATNFNNSGSSDINNWRPISCSNFSTMFLSATAFNQPIGGWQLPTASNISVNMSNMFNGAIAFNQNIGAWDVSRVTNTSGMFRGNNITFNNGGSPDINNWNTSNITDMSSMFWRSDFDQPVGNWDVSNVTNMSYMFFQTPFNQNIGAWNVEKVTSMDNMLRGPGAFNNSGSSDINNWRPISCSNFQYMFSFTNAFNQPLGNWPLSASNIDISRMFQNADAFDQDLGSWDVSRVTAMTYTFDSSNTFNNGGSPNINNWTPVSCSSFQGTFQVTPFNQPVEGWTLATDRSIDMLNMFYNASNFNQPLGNWNIVSASDMTNMLTGTAIDIPNYTKTLRGWGDLANSTGVQTAVPLGASGKKYGAAHAQRKVLTDTYGWTITDGGQEPFVFTINTTASGYNPGSELTFTLPLTQNTSGSYGLDILVDWGDSTTSTISSSAQPEVTHSYSNSGSYEITITGSLFGFEFDNGGDKAKLTDVSKWSALEINGARSFRGCSNLVGTATDIPFINSSILTYTFNNASQFNGDISSWDVSNVTDMYGMFEGASSFDQNLGSWDVSNVVGGSQFEGLNNMFYNATAFNNGGLPDINNWDVSNATEMRSMFNNADAFNQNIGAWNVEKVTNMSSMFQSNGGFNNSGSSDINNWRPISCSNFTEMFRSATAFNQPIGNWPLSASNINMSTMFFNAVVFNQNLGSWDTSRVTNMTQMFRDASNFNNSGSSDINNWNTTNVTDMSQMFYGASSFNQPIGNWDTSNVTTMLWMFRGASNFNQDISTWNVGKVTSFLRFIEHGSYPYLTNIYSDTGWIRNQLQPKVTASLSGVKYSGSAAEGRALLERPYVTQSITNIQDSASFINIVTLAPHNLTPNNKVFIFGVSGSISGSVNGLRTVLSTGSATEFTLSGSLWNPSQTYDVNTGTVITGYGWNITDGGPV